MEEFCAKLLIEKFTDLDKELGACIDAMDHISSSTERNEFRAAIAEITGDIYYKLMRPIVAQYPNLDPDNE